jgi:hypothetical protein
MMKENHTEAETIGSVFVINAGLNRAVRPSLEPVIKERLSFLRQI